MNVMQVVVVSNEDSIYSGEATFAVVPTLNGELGIYPKHEPIMSLVRPGALRLTVPNSNEEVFVALAGGVLEVRPHKITILADVAVRSEELDRERSEASKKSAEEWVAKAKGTEDAAKAHAALAKAIAELKTLDYLRVHR